MSKIDYNEEQYTDYAVQFMTSYFSEDSEIVETLMNSYDKKEFHSPMFFPGLVLGLIVHFKLFLEVVSSNLGKDSSEVYQEYVQYYTNQVREKIIEGKMLSPTHVKTIMEEISKGEE
jgi:hypothetical protein